MSEYEEAREVELLKKEAGRLADALRFVEVTLGSVVPPGDMTGQEKDRVTAAYERARSTLASVRRVDVSLLETGNGGEG